MWGMDRSDGRVSRDRSGHRPHRQLGQALDVLAQARAASLPLTAKCSVKNEAWSSWLWKWCGVRTAEMIGTSVSSWTRISPVITASATKS